MMTVVIRVNGRTVMTIDAQNMGTPGGVPDPTPHAGDRVYQYHAFAEEMKAHDHAVDPAKVVNGTLIHARRDGILELAVKLIEATRDAA
jgi:hypothetical protein